MVAYTSTGQTGTIPPGGQRRLLATWLRLNYPMDVLMPTAGAGSKAPGRKHAGGAWTWGLYDASLDPSSVPTDVGILLHDLCVVDADSPAAAAALEQAHPVLTRVPMERTRHGFHYYLGRSALADLHGYYDCRASGPQVSQVRQGTCPATATPTACSKRVANVDFKSRCLGGGAGFIVTAPSEGKTWVRTPWDTFPDGALPDVTPELLEAVSYPHHAPVSVRFRFCGEGDAGTIEPLLCESRWLEGMTFLDMFLGDGDNDIDVAADALPPLVPLPAWIRRPAFLDTLRMLELEDPLQQGCLSAAGETSDGSDSDNERAARAYEAGVDEMIRIADFMGVADHGLARIRSAGAGGGRNRADLMRVSPAWAFDVVTAATSAGAGVMVDIDTALSCDLLHVPLGRPGDGRWLLPNAPRSSVKHPCQRVLERDPVAAARHRLPLFVLQSLQAEAGHLALAGGAALAAVIADESRCEPSDYDLYVYGLTGTPSEIATAADGIARRVAERRQTQGRMLVTGHAVTMCVARDGHDRLGPESVDVVQIVLRVAHSLSDIVSGFDLSPSKVVITCLPPGPPRPPCPPGPPGPPCPPWLGDSESDSESGNEGDSDDEYGMVRLEQFDLRIVASPDWVVSMRHMAFCVDGRRWSRASALRVFKYVAKGFDAVVPGLRDRGRLVPQGPPPPRVWLRPKRPFARLDGFELLFAIEAAMETRTRAGRDRPQARLQGHVIYEIARDMAIEHRSDYATARKDLGAIASIVLGAGTHILRRLGILPATPGPAMTWLSHPLPWRQPWSRAQFHPCHADVMDAMR